MRTVRTPCFATNFSARNAWTFPTAKNIRKMPVKRGSRGRTPEKRTAASAPIMASDT